MLMGHRHRFPFAMAAAVIDLAALTGAAYAQERWSFRPWLSPPNVTLFCQQRWQCGPHGCGWQRICAPQTFASSYLWQVRDNWPPEALARYDDAWCRVYGPPGSWDYGQCRVNNYYTRASVPIRQTR
jgi:hypothetical protein